MDSFNVLMYHEIIKEEDFDPAGNSAIVVNQGYKDILPKPLFVYFRDFGRQMEYLHENGYTTLKLQDLMEFYYEGKALPEKSVLLTFDDMYKSTLLYAYPILKKYKFSAVGFVVLDWIFNEERQYSSSSSVCLSKGELEGMRDVFEYANHTRALHTRNNGLTALQTVDKETFRLDTTACEEFVDVKNVYAYPFGIYNEDIIHWLKELNYKLAFTTETGANCATTEPLKLRRNGVFLGFNIQKFKAILEQH